MKIQIKNISEFERSLVSPANTPNFPCPIKRSYTWTFTIIQVVKQTKRDPEQFETA